MYYTLEEAAEKVGNYTGATVTARDLLRQASLPRNDTHRLGRLAVCVALWGEAFDPKRAAEYDAVIHDMTDRFARGDPLPTDEDLVLGTWPSEFQHVIAQFIREHPELREMDPREAALTIYRAPRLRQIADRPVQLDDGDLYLVPWRTVREMEMMGGALLEMVWSPSRPDTVYRPVRLGAAVEDLRVREEDLAEYLATVQPCGLGAPDEMLASANAGRKWPWGDHETKTLGHLEAAGQRFWKLYDPADPTTAPTNKDVIDWLVNTRNTPRRVAESIASMLRPEDLKPGPRR